LVAVYIESLVVPLFPANHFDILSLLDSPKQGHEGHVTSACMLVVGDSFVFLPPLGGIAIYHVCLFVGWLLCSLTFVGLNISKTFPDRG